MVTTMVSLKIYLRRVAVPSSEFPLLHACIHQYVMWQIERDGEKYSRGCWKQYMESGVTWMKIFLPPPHCQNKYSRCILHQQEKCISHFTFPISLCKDCLKSIEEAPAWGTELWIKSRCVWKIGRQGVHLPADQGALGAVPHHQRKMNKNTQVSCLPRTLGLMGNNWCGLDFLKIQYRLGHRNSFYYNCGRSLGNVSYRTVQLFWKYFMTPDIWNTIECENMDSMDGPGHYC